MKIISLLIRLTDRNYINVTLFFGMVIVVIYLNSNNEGPCLGATLSISGK